MSAPRYTMTLLPPMRDEATEVVNALPVEMLLRVPTEGEELVEELLTVRLDSLEELTSDDVTITTEGTFLRADFLLPRPLAALPEKDSDRLGQKVSFRQRQNSSTATREMTDDLARLVVTYDTSLWRESAKIVEDVRALIAAYRIAHVQYTDNLRGECWSALQARYDETSARARIDQLARSVDRALREQA